MIVCLGGNDIYPTSSKEFIFAVALMILALFINSLLFGEMTFLTTVISKKQVEYQRKVDMANTAMKNIELPNYLTTKVRDYYLLT